MQFGRRLPRVLGIKVALDGPFFVSRGADNQPQDLFSSVVEHLTEGRWIDQDRSMSRDRQGFPTDLHASGSLEDEAELLSAIRSIIS